MATQMDPAAPPRPQLVSVDGKSYPLESARVTSRAEGGIAATTLTQRFTNPHDEALEVIYSLPLPADGAVLGYEVRVGERVIRGEVQPRERAERAYRDALYEGRTAGLLEQDRADTFQQRLGNLPPRTPVEVEIQLIQPLRFLAATAGRAPQWEFRFPTVTGVRYEGEPGRVPDAERLDVNRGEPGDIPARVELAVVIGDAIEPEPGIVSPSHRIAVDVAAAEARVRFEQGERLNRDVVLCWNAAVPDVGIRVVEGGGLAGDDGRYALVTIVPPAALEASLERDLTVLIDASGSMAGAPLELAKTIVAELVASLEAGDRFELLAFANRVDRLTDGLVSVSPQSKERALDRLARLEASGATEMVNAFERALEPLRAGAQRQIVLVTDGYIGFEDRVIGRIASSLPAGCRVHAVGIGAAPNRTLLNGVAAAGRGVELAAGDPATAIEAARRLRIATVRPVLTELEVRGTAVRAAAPQRPRDVFEAQPLVLTLELEPRGGTLQLSGKLAGATTPWLWMVEVGEAAERSPLPIGALHGRAVIADLELERTVGARADVDNDIERCGMRHRIVSRRTSLVAIAEEPSVDPTAPRRRERLAVELPEGVSAEGAGLTLPKLMSIASSVAAGATMVPMLEFRPSLVESMFERAAHMIEPPVDFVRPRVEVVRIDGDLLVLEIESPCDGFMLPAWKFGVEVGRDRIQAQVVAEHSSAAGPHDKGVLLRLAVRAMDRRLWLPSDPLVVSWGFPSAPADGSKSIVHVKAIVTPPAPHRAPEAT